MFCNSKSATTSLVKSLGIDFNSKVLKWKESLIPKSDQLLTEVNVMIVVK